MKKSLDSHIPPPRDLAFEIHAGDLRQGSGTFRGVPVAKRVAIRNDWLRIAATHGLRFIYRAIAKNRYERWMKVNPHLAAFPLVAQVVNNFLRSLGKNALGIFISGHNREVVGDLERFPKLLRATPGTLRLDRIIEEGFFIDSRKSLLLQLADLCTLHARKDEERKLGSPPKTIEDEGIDLLKILVHQGRRSLLEHPVAAADAKQKERRGAPVGLGSPTGRPRSSLRFRYANYIGSQPHNQAGPGPAKKSRETALLSRPATERNAAPEKPDLHKST